MVKKLFVNSTAFLESARERILTRPVAGKALQSLEKKGTPVAFYGLLYAYLWLFRFTAHRHEAFKQRLAEKDFTMLMKDKGETLQRWYTFQGGKMTSTASNGPEPTFSLIWKNIPVGCKVMTDMAMGKPKVLKNAIIKGDLGLGGDAAMVAWFLETNNMMARLNK